jgi:hypothetical protein
VGLPRRFADYKKRRTGKMDDPHLVSVSAEVRRLEKAVSDAEWDSDPRMEMLIAELNHYKDLQAAGILYEPDF